MRPSDSRTARPLPGESSRPGCVLNEGEAMLSQARASDRGERNDMRVVARQDAVEFIREQGGRLYVWADLMRCTGRSCTFFTSAVEAPKEPHPFRQFGGGGFELFFSDEGLEAPAELRLELTGRRKKRISVYEGSWVIADEIP